MDKFWKWIRDQAESQDSGRTLFLNGTIASESWLDNDVTPALFKSDLESGEGDITVWINSPGGDCFAAAQIYNMLRDYPGKVTVKIDGIAASAASVIAMAGDMVMVSPVSMLMIHNPATIAAGDHNDMTKAIEMLESVKDSIINAYQTKTGMSRSKLSRLMEDETWMDATKAVELGFADSVIERETLKEQESTLAEDGEDASDHQSADRKEDIPSMLFSRRACQRAVTNKLEEHFKVRPKAQNKEIETPINERPVADLQSRLDLIKQYF